MRFGKLVVRFAFALCIVVGAWYSASRPISVLAEIRATDESAQANTRSADFPIGGARAEIPAHAQADTQRTTNDIPAALPQNAAADQASPEAQAVVQQYMAGPSVFIENAGQWADDSIRFALDGAGANVGLTDQGPRFQLFRKTSTPSAPSDLSDPSAPAEMHEFGVTFDGAAHVTPSGRGKSDRTFNYLRGDVANHRDGVPSFETIWYDDLYPGVALELTGSRTGIKYNFHLAPGADWRAIRSDVARFFMDFRNSLFSGFCGTTKGMFIVAPVTGYESLQV